MLSEKRISVVLPVYNEKESIRTVAASIHNALRNKIAYEIIIVDDGSKDGTRELLKEIDARVILHPVNIGYGQALLSGIAAAKYENIVTIDSDGSYSADDIIRLVIEGDDANLVIGQRTGKEFWGSLIKHPARFLFLLLAEFTVGQKIPDVNSGLRLFKKSSFDEVNFPIICRGFSFSSTMTLSFFASGMFVKFVPISYLTRSGESKVNYLRDTLRTLQTLVEIVTYYNPLKIILLIDALPALLSIVFLITYAVNHSLWAALFSLLSFHVMLVIFVMGLIIDAIRLKKR